MISKYTSNHFGYPDNVLVELKTFTAFFKIAAVEICFMVNSVQFSSFTQSCPTFCDPMNHSMPGLPVHHHLPESIQTLVH